MKQRIITAAIGIILFFIVLFFFDTPVFNAAIAAIAVLAVYELLHSTKYVKDRLVLGLSMAFAATIPFWKYPFLAQFGVLPVCIYGVLLFALLLWRHETVTFTEISVAFCASLLFPFSLSTLLFLREQFPYWQAMFYVLMIFSCAWGADTGAFFIGSMFGKKKLAPKISPNKTVEGLFGGIVIGVGIAYAVAGVFVWILSLLGISFSCNWLLLGGLALPATLLSVFGDLSASIIKRQAAIKDFGSIFPGHGGVLDRFDSVFAVALFFYLTLQYIAF
jgi:phosphatidate cytidylyltransferase